MQISSIYKSIIKDLTDHAYFIVGEKSIFETLSNDLVEHGHTEKNSMDFLRINTPMFSMDDARDFRLWLQTVSITGGKKIAIIATSTIGEDAQNALLKSLEDTPKNTHIFIIKDSLSKILPTLLSRMYTVDLTSLDEKRKEAKEFLAMSVPKRLDYVAKFIKKYKDEGDKDELFLFFSDLENELSSNKTKEIIIDAEFVLKAKNAIRDSGAPIKIIFEAVAITLPQA